MEVTGQRQYCLWMLYSEAELRTSVRCRQSRFSFLICLLFVSVWLLLLFLYVVVSLLLVDCSDETSSVEVCGMIDHRPSWKVDVKELAPRSVEGLLSDCCRNNCMLVRLQCTMQRRFT